MEKEKVEKTYGYGEANYRSIEILKQAASVKTLASNRALAPAVSISSIATAGGQHIQAMPPQLLPNNYITARRETLENETIGPRLLNQIHPNSLVRTGKLGPSYHPVHIPIGIGATATALSQPHVATQRNALVPLLKPANQVQLTQLSSRPTVMTPIIAQQHRSSSPSTSELEHRTHLADHHHGVRGNLQATLANHASGPATIQVIASGTAASSHLHSYLNKNLTAGTGGSSSPNLLKIGAAGATPPYSAGAVQLPSQAAFKIGISKGYQVGSSIIIPSTTIASSVSRPDSHQVIERISGSFIHHPSSQQNSASPHNFPPQSTSVFHPTASANSAQHHPAMSHATTNDSANERVHSSSLPYPIGAYVVHEPGSGFPHSLNMLPQNATFHPLIRSPLASSVFSVDVQRQGPPNGLSTTSVVSQGPPPHCVAGLSSIPLLAIASSLKNNPSIEAGHRELHRVELVNPHSAGYNSSTSTFFPNQNYAPSVPTNESSMRPTILRKRPVESNTTIFPVQPTEREQLTSPMKNENSIISSIPPKIHSPPKLHSHDKSGLFGDVPKPTNHSITSITADTRITGSPEPLTMRNAISPPTAAAHCNLPTVANTTNEVSPKKKPRKQHIITTEDKYSTPPSILQQPLSRHASPHVADDDEEFLKANETMKEETPPKTTTAVVLVDSLVSPLTARGFDTASLDTTASMPLTVKQEALKETINGVVASPMDMRTNDALRQLFRKKPRTSIYGSYKPNVRAAHNHFHRYSDMRIKDEKRVTLTECCTNRTFMESSTGWRLHHISAQLDELVSLEDDVCNKIIGCQKAIPRPSRCSPDFRGAMSCRTSLCNSNLSSRNSTSSSEDKQLRLLHDLVLGNIQRCKLGAEQLREAKTSMLKLLEHKTRALELLAKHKPKARLKKKNHSTA